MKNMNSIAPIADPRRVYAGQILFMVTANKITKNEIKFSASIIGSTIQFAAIQKIKVVETALNDRETGLVVNKSTDNITIHFDPASTITTGDGAIFDEEKKAQAVAKSINVVNIERLEALQEEISGAKSFLDQLINEGA